MKSLLPTFISMLWNQLACHGGHVVTSAGDSPNHGFNIVVRDEATLELSALSETQVQMLAKRDAAGTREHKVCAAR